MLNLLEDMKQRYGLTLLFISHDLSVVKNVSDRIIVMYLGKACEIANADELYEHPVHPYTRALLASIPEPAPTVDPAEGDIKGELPSPINPPAGCRFNTRCPHATDICHTEELQMQRLGDRDHCFACHHPVEVAVGL
ncbi:MAG: ABC transporter ATP-binding protein [Acidimicrobiales bacterium]